MKGDCCVDEGDMMSVVTELSSICQFILLFQKQDQVNAWADRLIFRRTRTLLSGALTFYDKKSEAAVFPASQFATPLWTFRVCDSFKRNIRRWLGGSPYCLQSSISITGRTSGRMPSKGKGRRPPASGLQSRASSGTFRSCSCWITR